MIQATFHVDEEKKTLCLFGLKKVERHKIRNPDRCMTAVKKNDYNVVVAQYVILINIASSVGQKNGDQKRESTFASLSH